MHANMLQINQTAAKPQATSLSLYNNCCTKVYRNNISTTACVRFAVIASPFISFSSKSKVTNITCIGVIMLRSHWNYTAAFCWFLISIHSYTFAFFLHSTPDSTLTLLFFMLYFAWQTIWANCNAHMGKSNDEPMVYQGGKREKECFSLSYLWRTYYIQAVNSAS